MESDKSRTIHGRKICIYELVKKRPRQYEKEYSETQEVQEEGDSSYTSSSSSNQSDLADADDEWQDEMHNENYEEESSTTNRRRSCSYKLKG
jgi:Rad3-related DNA helicase